jgi:hypothetical protein
MRPHPGHESVKSFILNDLLVAHVAMNFGKKLDMKELPVGSVCLYYSPTVADTPPTAWPTIHLRSANVSTCIQNVCSQSISYDALIIVIDYYATGADDPLSMHPWSDSWWHKRGFRLSSKPRELRTHNKTYIDFERRSAQVWPEMQEPRLQILVRSHKRMACSNCLIIILYENISCYA